MWQQRHERLENVLYDALRVTRGWYDSGQRDEVTRSLISKIEEALSSSYAEYRGERRE
jgi:hypothetical protein